MVKIRLERRGVAGKPVYRIVATDSKNKKGGRALDIIGYWQPKKEVLKIDRKLLQSWKAKGAQITLAVAKLIEKN